MNTEECMNVEQRPSQINEDVQDFFSCLQQVDRPIHCAVADKVVQ